MSKNSRNLKIRYLLILPLLLVFVTGIYATEAKADGPIGMVKIEDCAVDEYGMDCDEKTTITLPVTYGMEYNMEALAVRQISKDGEPQTIEETFTISITKRNTNKPSTFPA